MSTHVLPKIMGQMGDRFSLLRQQYEETATQASELFVEAQHALNSLRSRQMQLSTAMISEQKTSDDHVNAIKAAKLEKNAYRGQLSNDLRAVKQEHHMHGDKLGEQDRHMATTKLFGTYSELSS